MYVFVRLLLVILRARRQPKVDPRAEIRTPLRIWPNDLDFNWHLNNGRYLTLFDLGRMDLVMRCGMIGPMWTHKWFPVLASATVRFRREVPAFAKVELTTRIVHWDEKWFWIEHRLEQDGSVVARGMVKGLFRGPEGNVPVRRLMQETGVDAGMPDAPELVRRWTELEKEMG